VAGGFHALQVREEPALVMAVMCVPMPPCFFGLPERQMMLPSSGVAGQFTNACHKNSIMSRKLTSETRRGKHYSANSACLELEFPLSSLRFMATLKPFAALRPNLNWPRAFVNLPYDVMSSDRRAPPPRQPAQFSPRQQAGD